MTLETNRRRFRLGVVINPYAGIGGAVALKGSDGADIRARALAAGAEQLANQKTQQALNALREVEERVEVFTAADDMGETCAINLGWLPNVVYHPPALQTEACDTQAAVQAIMQHNIDLLVFAGGDGTARNIFDIVDQRVPVIGVPAGCKIHSGVYAVTPSAAGEIILQMVQGQLVSEIAGEVRDINESAFRDGKVISQFYGEMRVPDGLTYVQAVKMGGFESDELILADMVSYLAEEIEQQSDTYFVMGSGSTVAAIMAELNLDNTLLGVDVIKAGKCVLADATASQLIDLVERAPNKVKAVISIIGGQGHVFGRGNQQFSPSFIRRLGKQGFYIVASKSKLNSLENRPLRVDTGDVGLDQALQGPITLISGYRDKVLYPIE